MRRLRIAAYVFAVAAIVVTVPFAVAAEGEGLVVAVLAETLAVAPYVVVRAIEEVMNEEGVQTLSLVNRP